MKDNSLKVLLFGYINVNVIDGSSFFLSSLTSMLSDAAEIEVDLVLANPLTRSLVLDDIISRQNVNIIDPFADREIDRVKFPFLERTSMSHVEAALLLNHYWLTNNPDVIFIRSTEVGAALASISREAASRCALYVTGVVNGVQTPSREILHGLESAAEAGMSLICQTDEMKAHLEALLPSIESHKITALHPMVPDNPGRFEDYFVDRGSFSRFVYAGKFAVDWNPSQIISGILEARDEYTDISLEVAGDQFKSDPVNENFVREIRYLLGNSAGVNWVGGIPRSEARQLMLDSDVGIGWRSSTLDMSLELSTKLLEYGSFARPCIMNRTPMHERIFGSDYPLYANSMTEFVAAVKLVRSRPDLVRQAARVSFAAAREFTYTASFRRLVPLLLDMRDSTAAAQPDSVIDSAVLESLTSNHSSGVIENQNVVFADTSRVTIDDLLRITSNMDKPVICDSIGPFVAVSADSVGLDTVANPGIFDFYVSHVARSIAKQEIDAFKASTPENAGPAVDNSADMALLRKQLTASRQRAGSYKARLDSLQKSKLGRLQVEFWKSKDRKSKRKS